MQKIKKTGKWECLYNAHHHRGDLKYRIKVLYSDEMDL